jgi:hypothetical protein
MSNLSDFSGKNVVLPRFVFVRNRPTAYATGVETASRASNERAAMNFWAIFGQRAE